MSTVRGEENEAGRRLARKAIAECLERELGQKVQEEEVEIIAKKGEKPWTTAARDLDFSISHTCGVVAACAVRGARVGIDIEKIRGFAPQTSRAFLTLREHTYVKSDPRLLTVFWCVKEAYLKAIGTGLRVHPARVEVRWTDLEKESITLHHDGQAVRASIGWTEYQGYIIAHVLIPPLPHG